MIEGSAENNVIRTYIHLPSPLDAGTHRTRWKNGDELEECPYGLHNAEGDGFSLAFSRSYPPGRSVVERVLQLCDKATGLDIAHAWRNRAAIEAADIVWTVLEGEAIAILILSRLGLLKRRPLIAGTVWIFDRWNRIGPPRRLAYARLLADASIVTVHAQGCLDRLKSVLPHVNGRLLTFGVSGEAYLTGSTELPCDGQSIHIVAVGHDRTRDWQVMLDAVGNDPRFKLTILCRWFERALMTHYDNLSVPELVSPTELPAYYRSADYVAVPMRPNLFSGITVALEAAASGTPILCSRTGGVPTYFAEDEALYFRAGDADNLRERVLAQSRADRRAMAERAHKRFLASDYSTRGMAQRYRKLTKDILKHSC